MQFSYFMFVFILSVLFMGSCLASSKDDYIPKIPTHIDVIPSPPKLGLPDDINGDSIVSTAEKLRKVGQVVIPAVIKKSSSVVSSAERKGVFKGLHLIQTLQKEANTANGVNQ